MAVPQLWIVAGPNGAGKTTCVQRKPIRDLLPDIPFLNPDAITLKKLQARQIIGFADAPSDLLRSLFIESAREVETAVSLAVDQGRSIGVETVLSTTKYLPMVHRALASGGFFGLIYIALSTPAIACQRVARRVQEGGHDVPERKITERWHRSLDTLPHFARLATRFWIIDNSDSESDQLPSLLAAGGQGRVEFRHPGLSSEFQDALNRL